MKKLALILAPVLVPLSVYLVMVWTGELNHMVSFSLAYGLYWIFWCLAFPMWIMGRSGLKKILEKAPEPFGRPAILGIIVLAIPIILSFIFTGPFEGERDLWPESTMLMMAVAIPMSIWNGLLEEILWRGAFIRVFPRKLFWGVIFPAIGFGAWHLGPFLATEPWDWGKVIILLGGGSILGLCWNYIAMKTGSIRYTVYSHILANIALFTALSMV